MNQRPILSLDYIYSELEKKGFKVNQTIKPIVDKDKDRYKMVRRKGYRVLEHRYVWEKYNGKIPPGFETHHKDGNPRNNKIENLCLLSKIEHAKIHKEGPDRVLKRLKISIFNKNE